MQGLDTRISLPPGDLPGEAVRELLQLLFEEYRWFLPERYRFLHLDAKLKPGRIDYDALVAEYEQAQALTIAARTDRDFLIILPARRDEPPHAGGVTWVTSVKEATHSTWRAAHAAQVAAVMRRLNAPLAVAAVAEDIARKTQRLAPHPDGVGLTETSTVRDPSEGLAGLFWRNFFGPPFVSMFGERLDTLPGEFKQDLGQGAVLVQPYALPTQAGTPEGAERERQLIAHLGADCFYDHTRHTLPPRRPALSPDGSPR